MIRSLDGMADGFVFLSTFVPKDANGLPRSEKKIFPIWGYVILNLVALAIMAGIYFGSLSYARQHTFRSVGMFPVLLVCWLSFAFVSICDAVYERVSRRLKLEEKEQAAAAGREK